MTQKFAQNDLFRITSIVNIWAKEMSTIIITFSHFTVSKLKKGLRPKPIWIVI